MCDSKRLSTKESILQFLEQSKDWHSGQEMAQKLGISRAAVAKHMAGLRGEGHVIESVPKRGHRLIMKADRLEEEAILARLKTKKLGREQWYILPTTVSTGNELVQLAFQGAKEGTVVAAEAQSQGRGRKGHDWFSAPRAAQFSFLLRPPLAEINLQWLMQGAVVAVAQALRLMRGVEACVKVPNDVYIGSKKVAGVLIESGFRGEALDWVAVGIGCNINTLLDDFPDELQSKVTSLYGESERWTSRNAFIAEVLNQFEPWYEAVCGGEADRLQRIWQDLSIEGRDL